MNTAAWVAVIILLAKMNRQKEPHSFVSGVRTLNRMRTGVIARLLKIVERGDSPCVAEAAWHAGSSVHRVLGHVRAHLVPELDFPLVMLRVAHREYAALPERGV